MIGHSSRGIWGARVAIVVCVVLGIVISFGLLARGGLAEGTPPNPALEALLQTTPTPVPTPPTTACAVTIMPTMTLAADTATFGLVNDGTDVEVKGATVTWPESNGNLVEMTLGTAAKTTTVWQGAAEGGSATVFWDRTATIPVIKPGETLNLVLRFSKGATQGRYQLVLHLSRECYALFDNQAPVHNQACLTTFEALTVNGPTAELVVENTTPQQVEYGSVTVFWADEISALESVSVDGGANLLPGAAMHSPVEVTLPPETPGLAPGAALTLQLGFAGDAPLVNYTIILRGDACESVFSNAMPPVECPISQVGKIAVATSTMGVILQNPGPVAQPIRRLWVDYPGDNGSMTDVRLDDASIANYSAGFWEQPEPPASMTAGVELLADASLPPNSRSALTFDFSQDAQEVHYTIDLTYGDSCRLLTSTRSDESEDCQLAVAGDNPLSVEGNRARLAIENTGSVPAEPMAIQVDWTSQLNGRLTQVDVGDSVFWTGDSAGEGGSLTVTHNTAEPVRVLQPGETIAITFTFSSRAVAEPYVFFIRFAEGCDVSYSTGPDLTMPPVVEFRGRIETIPDAAFDGEWDVQVAPERSWTLRVTPRTTILPPGLSPVEGDIVTARALRLSADRYLGLEVRITPNRGELIEMSGVIEDVDPAPTPEWIQVQSVTVDVTAGTEVSGELKEGWLADVTGFVRPNGSIEARTITTTEPSSGARQVDFEGTVDRYWPLTEGESVWVVSGIVALVNADTILHAILPGVEPEIGAYVRIAGALQSDGSVRVHELWYDDGEETYDQFDGIIRDLPVDDPQLLGTWIIERDGAGICDPDVNRDAEACVPILVTASTFIDISLDIPSVGAPVEVRVHQMPNGNWECEWLKVLVDDDDVGD